MFYKTPPKPRTTPNPSQAEGEGPEGPWEVGSATAAAAHAADGGHGLGQAGGTTRGGGETTEGGLGIGKNDDIKNMKKTWMNWGTVLICTINIYKYKYKYIYIYIYIL